MLKMPQAIAIPSAALTSSPWIGSQLEKFRGVSPLSSSTVDTPSVLLIYAAAMRVFDVPNLIGLVCCVLRETTLFERHANA